MCISDKKPPLPELLGEVGKGSLSESRNILQCSSSPSPPGEGFRVRWKHRGI